MAAVIIWWRTFMLIC